ncbi:hypothetical protein [Legionella sp. km772]|uniref:hypothetical protein n=1 Tax=Legionella sp. km772 TaxID=2498111 RepID=UPI000F8DBE63|nr:hypothetical protein [Legionella sp. km772]RUR13964.1 hypothetical protein ELY15_00885 [Legionella sp. km772]
MSKMIKLSDKTQELIKQYKMLAYSKKESLDSFSSVVEQRVLINWLHEEVSTPSPVKRKIKKEMEFLLASLRVELLRDLLLAMDINPESYKKNESAPSNKNNLKFYLLAIAGTVLAACEGFDSITSLLGVFALPSMITLMAGLAFSALSVMVFYGFNLVQVAKNLDVKLRDAPKLLDLYLLQLDEIKSLRKKINTYKLARLSLDELNDLAQVVSMLESRLAALGESSKQFNDALNSPHIKLAKNLFVGIAGLMFFGSGFFAGQSVSVFLLGLIMGSVLPTFLPVVLVSTAVGLAAFSLYWYVEKVGLQQLISGWFGLDEEKIEKLCSSAELEKQTEKLSNLKEKIVETAELARQLKDLQAQGKQEPQPDLALARDETRLLKNSAGSRPKSSASGNIYSFHQSLKAAPKSILAEEAEASPTQLDPANSLMTQI